MAIGNLNMYAINSSKTWQQTMGDITFTFEKWGVRDWRIDQPSGAYSRSYHQEELARTVHLSYTKNGRLVALTMGSQVNASKNLRVLYLAVEAMRMNEKRGIGEVLENAYKQLAAPIPQQDPYTLLEITRETSLEIAEAAYRTKAKRLHSDSGGNDSYMKALNEAIAYVREQYGKDK